MICVDRDFKKAEAMNMKKTLVNGRLLFMVILFSLLIILGAVAWSPDDWAENVFMIGLGTVLVIGTFLLLPCAYRFDEHGVTLYYGFVIRTRAEWKEIRYVREQFGGASFPWWSEYCIGGFSAKFPLYREGRLPKTKKTTKLLQTYWHKKIG